MPASKKRKVTTSAAKRPKGIVDRLRALNPFKKEPDRFQGLAYLEGVTLADMYNAFGSGKHKGHRVYWAFKRPCGVLTIFITGKEAIVGGPSFSSGEPEPVWSDVSTFVKWLNTKLKEVGAYAKWVPGTGTYHPNPIKRPS